MKTSVPKCLLSIPSCRWQFCLISSWGNWIFNSPSATDKFIMVSDHSVGSEELRITSTFSFDRWFPRQSKQSKVSPQSNKVWIYSQIKRFDDLHTCWKYFLSSLTPSGAGYLCIMTAPRVHSITFQLHVHGHCTQNTFFMSSQSLSEALGIWSSAQW